MFEDMLQRVNDAPAWILYMCLIIMAFHMHRCERAIDAQAEQLSQLEDRLDDITGEGPYADSRYND